MWQFTRWSTMLMVIKHGNGKYTIEFSDFTVARNSMNWVDYPSIAALWWNRMVYQVNIMCVCVYIYIYMYICIYIYMYTHPHRFPTLSVDSDWWKFHGYHLQMSPVPALLSRRRMVSCTAFGPRSSCLWRHSCEVIVVIPKRMCSTGGRSLGVCFLLKKTPLPSGNQRWRAGKCPFWTEVWIGNHLWTVHFQHAMVDYRRVNQSRNREWPNNLRPQQNNSHNPL